MSDNSLFSDLTARQRLVAEITFLQLKGASLAAAVFFGAWIVIAVLHWVGTTILPSESQTADSPQSEAFLTMPDQ